ncbi:hypothetical protein [Shewanella vaxholmensis]|uniref:hypothetical protein n=1 Tax=Shewanella vaxholmensis TaxID=3063535 RepID=UPI003192BFC8
MSYVDPSTVISPKTSVSAVRVLEDKQEGSFSIARIRYDNEDVIACRWNGSDSEPSGHPNSRGIPTWFIIPTEIENDILQGVIKRAETDRSFILQELVALKKELSDFKHTGTGTHITIYQLKKIRSLTDANLLVELVRTDNDLEKLKVDVFDMDNKGTRTKDPISLLGEKLHLSLVRQID